MLHICVPGGAIDDAGDEVGKRSAAAAFGKSFDTDSRMTIRADLTANFVFW